jgi:hypothetical protein
MFRGRRRVALTKDAIGWEILLLVVPSAKPEN